MVSLKIEGISLNIFFVGQKTLDLRSGTIEEHKSRMYNKTIRFIKDATNTQISAPRRDWRLRS